jgi:hypothetical protein
MFTDATWNSRTEVVLKAIVITEEDLSPGRRQKQKLI